MNLILPIIQNNPYRLIGVYVNAPVKERVANNSRLNAYLKIGKSVSFPADLSNLLPILVRTTDSIEQANAQINLLQNQVRYALFWFINGSPIDGIALSHLQNGNIDKAKELFGKKETFSSLQNRGILSFIEGNEGDAISNITKMIHDENHRDGFVKCICGDSFLISEEELAHAFIDELLKYFSIKELLEKFDSERLLDNGPLEDDVNYLKEKAVGEQITKINAEITKAQNVNRDNADAQYNAGISLMNNTKEPLSQINNLMEASDVLFQMVGDNLAKTILQCGINYFNNSDDNNDIDKALVLQEYALKVSIGKLTKDRCQENVNILKQKEKENVVVEDIKAVTKDLESFQTKYSSISNAKSLVENSKVHLQKIRSILGEKNEFYLNMSTAVANNSLGMVVSVVNSEQSNNVNIKNGSLKTTINGALSIVSLIETLDMTEQVRLHLVQNRKTLSTMQYQMMMIEEAKPKPIISDGCYIATMVYGDYNHPQVMVLRNFRDSVLQKHLLGKVLVKFYYRYSPTWVEYLKNEKWINDAIRNILDKFIILYKYGKK